MHGCKSRLRRLIYLGIAAVAMASLALVALSGCNEDDIERKLGTQEAAAIEAHFKVVDDPLLADWIENVGQTCKSHSRRQKIPYEFKIVDTDMVNAVAAPYGHIYVTMGLLDFVNTEDEVWVVVGHEVGHIVNRDSMKAVKQSLLYSIPTFFAYGEGRTVGDVTQLAFEAWGSHYSREDEYRADDKGTELAYAAGHDPTAGPAFFAHLKQLDDYRPSKFESYFLSHPPLPRRIARQQVRDFLSDKNGEALIQTGEGYAARGQYRKAIDFLARGLELQPARVDARLILAQAYQARHELPAAQTQFQAVLQVQPDNAAGRTALAALQNAPAPIAAAGDADRLARARDLLARVRATAQRAQQVATTLDQYEASARTKLAPVETAAKDTAKSLLDLAGATDSFGPGVDRAIIQGDLAVATANEALYVLESGDSAAQEASDRLQAGLAATEAALSQAASGSSRPVNLEVINRSLAETARALDELESYAAEAPRTTERLQQAGEAARQTAVAMQQFAYRSNDFTRDQLTATIEQTDSRAFEALKAVSKPRAQADLARTRAYLTQINLATAGLDPWAETICDQILAHFLQAPSEEREATRPEDVRALRVAGRGYGEAALLLAASCSTGQPVENFSVAGQLSLVDAVRSRGVRLRNINVMLKFAANAISEELGVELPRLPAPKARTEKQAAGG